MGRIQLEAVGLEFEDAGNTIWVQGVHGTLLRIKCSGQIKVKHCEAPGAHADVLVAGDIEVCVPASTRAARGSVRRPSRVSTVDTVHAVGRRAGSVPAALTVVRATGRSSVTGSGGRRVGRGSRSGGRGRP
jgi:hypothetical protein